MKKTNIVWLVLLCIVVGSAFFVMVDNKITPNEDESIHIEREQQHIVAMEKGADPSLGAESVPSDGYIDSNFVSHLPLVIIDIDDAEIPITKMTTEDQQVLYTGEDPYVLGEIGIVDNENCENRLSDQITFTSKIKIKYRGNLSLNFDKKQYGIKLIDEAGNSIQESVMGMEANNDWILNISQLDESLIRNYLAYNVGSALFEETPDCKYCEVIFKEGNKYNYKGLYLMMEKVEKGKGRVELGGYDPGEKLVDYLLCRDREDDTEIQISTYGNQTGLTSGRLSIVYPDEDVIDDYAFNYIQNDIDKIDRILYSEDDAVFSSWPEFIDTQSFTDYFIFNELFGNYDAGHNSTYMYKKGAGKLCMGPLWDYDGAMDNSVDISNPEYLAFYESPWFERLVTSRRFMTYAYDRYETLTQKGNILSDEFITDYIEDVSAFIGNAALRDWSRWKSVYDNNKVHDAEDADGNIIYRDCENWADEVISLKSYFVVKEQYLGGNLKELFQKTQDREHLGTYFAVVMISLFICTIVLIRRKDMY
ncbi:MAG: CotH kinase family protein [Butyrivibrio sp.]|nr:CotH kinase family protein [Butyrivibrio sp.]